MFKDKVKVTVVALVMVLLMVLSVTTDLFVGLADVFRAKAEEATPTDAAKVTRDVTVYKELNDSDKDRNLAGAVIKVFKDSACTQSVTEFVLSYDGKSYGGDDRVAYKSLEERANANASKAIAKLETDTYYYQLDKKLFNSNDDYSKTGYDYNSVVGSFTVSEGDEVQEVKLDNDMFRPTEKVATPTDASSEASSEATTEVSSEATTQVATPSDVSSEDTEVTTQIATPTDSIPEVEPVVTLAAIVRAASGKVWVNGYYDSTCGNYHIVSAKNSDINRSVNGDIDSRVFCVTKEKWGPCTQNTHDGALQYSKGAGVTPELRQVIAYYYDKLPKTAATLAQVQHYLSLLNGHEGEKPSWANAASEYTALAKGDQGITISSSKPTVTFVDSRSFGSYTEKNVFISERLTVTATKSAQYFNYEVPNGCTVYVYRNKTWYKATSDGKTHTLKDKDVFYVVTPKANANKTFSISGTAQYGGWDVYYYYPDDDSFPNAINDFQTMILAAETAKPKFALTFKTEELPDPINIEIRKIDSVTGKTAPIGTTSLSGAIFKMEYFQGKTTASGTPTNTWYIRTVKDGSHYRAAFSKTCLVTGNKDYPSDTAPKDVDSSGVYELYDGCMRITEVKAPSGYEKVTASNAGWIKLGGSIDRLTGSASITVKIGNGNIYYGNTAVKDGVVEIGEQKERYDFKLKKVDSYGNPMAGVAFLVTASNGDQHVVVTDKNGEFDSSKLGYTNVNGNDATLAKALADTTLYPTYKETNVFFTTPGSGKTAATEIKEETVGTTAPRPLYKDTYTVREIHRQYVTVDGKKYKLTQVYDLGPEQTFTVPDSAKDGDVLNFGTYTNTAIPKMTSNAISTDTNTKMSVAGKSASFKDSITATNLKASTKYTLMSVAVDANTGKAYKDANGKYVAKNAEFTTGAVKKGTVFPETTASVTFTGVNTSNVKSRKLVFYEYLVEGSVTKTVSLDSAGKPVEPANCVAKDASVSNEAQSVYVISLETKVLVNSTKTNESPAAVSVVTDTVSLHGLIAKESFTINSTVKVDGKSIGVQSNGFTAKGNDEEVSVVFDGIDLSKLANKRLSIVTELVYKGKVILTHNDDGKDLNEEFYTPEMHSNAVDVDTLTKMSKTSEAAKFKDTVDIKNLSTATQYTLQSIAVDTTTGLAFKDADGKYVVGHKVFTTESAERQVTLENAPLSDISPPWFQLSYPVQTRRLRRSLCCAYRQHSGNRRNFPTSSPQGCCLGTSVHHGCVHTGPYPHLPMTAPPAPLVRDREL